MKKRILIIAGIVLGVVLIIAVAYIIYINSYVPSKDIADKVVFEGLNDSIDAGESYNSVTDKVKAAGKSYNPQLIIAVQSDVVGLEKSEIDFDSLTEEQMDAWLKAYRKSLKEQNSKNNGNIARELGLDYMNITYTKESYSPNITAEFKEPLTQKDIADIYRIARNSKVVKVTVLLDE